MKKIFFLLFLLISVSAFSQFSFGLRGGLNYGSLDSFSDFKEGGMGYHIGLHSRIDFPLIYIMPELVYTKLTGVYKNGKTSADIDLQKIDFPVSVGIKMLKIFSVFAGPGLQYIINTDSNSESLTINSISKEISLFFNIGAGVRINDFGVYIRYEKGVSDSAINFLEKKIIPLSLKKSNISPDHFALSLTYSF